ncbi:hypothetical protein MHY85_07065, partial [Cellulomonas sp. ACRRI]|nr:hypothetical protein [Cellulomonas sp. ACRRI]
MRLGAEADARDDERDRHLGRHPEQVELPLHEPHEHEDEREGAVPGVDPPQDDEDRQEHHQEADQADDPAGGQHLELGVRRLEVLLEPVGVPPAQAGAEPGVLLPDQQRLPEPDEPLVGRVVLVAGLELVLHQRPDDDGGAGDRQQHDLRPVPVGVGPQRDDRDRHREADQRLPRLRDEDPGEEQPEQREADQVVPPQPARPGVDDDRREREHAPDVVLVHEQRLVEVHRPGVARREVHRELREGGQRHDDRPPDVQAQREPGVPGRPDRPADQERPADQQPLVEPLDRVRRVRVRDHGEQHRGLVERRGPQHVPHRAGQRAPAEQQGRPERGEQHEVRHRQRPADPVHQQQQRHAEHRQRHRHPQREADDEHGRRDTEREQRLGGGDRGDHQADGDQAAAGERAAAGGGRGEPLGDGAAEGGPVRADAGG